MKSTGSVLDCDTLKLELRISMLDYPKQPNILTTDNLPISNESVDAYKFISIISILTPDLIMVYISIFTNMGYYEIFGPD